MIRALGLLSIASLAGGCIYLFTRRSKLAADDTQHDATPDDVHAFVTWLEWAEKDAELFSRLFDKRQLSPEEYAELANDQLQNGNNELVQWIVNEKAIFERKYVKKDISAFELEEICFQIAQNDEMLALAGIENEHYGRCQMGLVFY